MNIKNVFVIGIGTMGLDIAQVFASHGLTVFAYARSEASLNRAQNKLNTSLSKRVARGKMTQEAMDTIVGNICWQMSFDRLPEAELVIEAVAEDANVKREIYQKVDAICPPETIIASNTSSISITELASFTNRPDRFIGMHFFNPATVMKLIELIRGMNTSDETFETIRELSIAMDKQPVEVSECPGFVVNRILIPMINEACFIVQDGVASIEDVDTAMKLGANHPMGPLALGDLIGLDVCLAIMDTMFNETHDSKFRACPLLRKMVRAGLLGKKTGKGFYDYSK